MKNSSGKVLFIIISFFLLAGGRPDSPDDYIISREKGKIILAYKAFGDFLDSDKSWESYRSIVLDPYPAIRKVHQRQIEWGDLDTTLFPDQVRNYKKEDFAHFMDRYTQDDIDYLYDSIIERSHRILAPVHKKEVDLCFFLPYGGGCFVIPEDSLNTIYISMYIDPAEAEKIMAHEYAHILHIDRRPKEPLTLRREIVSEGMAVFLTTMILRDIEVSDAIPFMPPGSFAWCLENEQAIKDSIRLELNDTTMRLFKRYISDGSWAEPPAGFVQKKGYFAGYRIIEACIRKGMLPEEICSLSADEVILKSGYFQ